MPRMSSRPYISKSKFLWGLQCHKLLWFAYNQKDAIPQPDAATHDTMLNLSTVPLRFLEMVAILLPR